MFENVNWIGVIIGAIIATAIGFAWYSDALFGKQWRRLLGITKEMVEKGKKDMPRMMALQILGALVMVYVLNVFIGYAGADTVMTGATVGLWAWLGFIATTMLASVIYEGKSWTLYTINAGYQLVTLVVVGGVLAYL